MKRLWLSVALVIAAAAVVCAAIVALCYRYDQGGGQSMVSPDGRYRVDASTLQRRGLLVSDPVRAVISLVSVDGIVVRRLVVAPVRSSDPYYFRGVPELIRWAGDSRSFTVAYDGLEQRVQVDR